MPAALDAAGTTATATDKKGLEFGPSVLHQSEKPEPNSTFSYLDLCNFGYYEHPEELALRKAKEAQRLWEEQVEAELLEQEEREKEAQEKELEKQQKVDQAARQHEAATLAAG
ncbi:unnamed protein product, partial [Amoebophrya sp. A25]|eukprot:GSA25T00006178001.1